MWDKDKETCFKKRVSNPNDSKEQTKVDVMMEKKLQ